jgi:lactate permease
VPAHRYERHIVAALPISPLLWLAAPAPLAAVLVLLIGLRWKASSAASAGYFLAAILALTLFQTSLPAVALQSVKGVWPALFIAWAVVTGLLISAATIGPAFFTGNAGR